MTTAWSNYVRKINFQEQSTPIGVVPLNRNIALLKANATVQHLSKL